MSVCLFTPQARDDLQQIYDYIAQSSPANALRLTDRIEERCHLLADYPYIRIARPEFGSSHRSFVVPGTRYIIVYRPVDDGVEIIHVRHGSQDLHSLFRR